MSEHPAHPAFIHYPYSFLSLSWILDITYTAATHPATGKLVSSVHDVTPYLGDIARFSHYLNILGLFTAVPAVLTGAQQLMVMLKKQDLAAKFEKSQNKAATAQSMHPKMKVAFAHAIFNYICVGGSVYTWWTRRSVPGYVPNEASPIIGASLLLLLYSGAFLGASLVYGHGVGVERQKVAKGPKAQ